ncbi:DnaJ-like protein subfamily C member 9 [Nematocida ausubeli]|nr:DnaJ-like protein subfamily C member 9 [Nematocida ausubeli]
MKREEAAEILGCTLESSHEEIRKSYRKLSMKMHPDRPGGSEEQFIRLNQAYELLTEKNAADREIITKNMFDRFREIYEGSQEEKDEIIALYKKHKGRMVKVIDNMMLGEDEQEDRYRQIINEQIKDKKIEEFKDYAKAKPLMMNKRRQEKRRREREAAEILAKDLEKRAEERQQRYNQMIERLEEKVAKPNKKKSKK